jgi:methionine-rich copper-binding protein CopC
MTRRGAASALWVGLAVSLTAGLPASAYAHPRLTRSDPAAAQRLTAMVSMLRLWFSERPELPLTSVVLSDSAGKAIALGAVAVFSDAIHVVAASG